MEMAGTRLATILGFAALYRDTKSLRPISSLLTLGRIGMRIGVKVIMPLEDKISLIFFPKGLHA